MLDDLRHGARRLAHSGAFAATAVLTIALAIGADTTIFSLVDGVLIRPLPYPEAERLVSVSHSAPGLGMPDAGLSDATYFHYRENSRALADLAIYQEALVNLTGDGEAERVELVLASGSLFSTMGVPPLHGRVFGEGEGRGGDLVVLSHGLWSRRYGSDPAAVGSTIDVNGVPREVVGVMPAGFDFPGPTTQIWINLGLDPARAHFAELHYGAVGRLAPGVKRPDQAMAELAGLVSSMAGSFDGATRESLERSGLRPIVRPLKEDVVGDVAPALWIVLAAVSIVLLAACLNVANLFLARAAYRRREVAMRTALGARRADLARYFLAESILLATVGGTLGAGLAAAGVSALVTFGPEGIPRLHEVIVDGRALAFSAALVVGASLLFAAAPLLRQRRQELSTAIREGGRGVPGRPSRQRARALLVVSQAALALVLTSGSLLTVQSFWRLYTVDPGFERRGILTAFIALPYRGYSTYDAGARFYREVLEGVRRLPGVEAAGAISDAPLGRVDWGEHSEGLVVEGRPSSAEIERNVPVRLVMPGYFETLRIPVLEGSGPAATDHPSPVLISATLARRLFPGQSAVGKRLRLRRPGLVDREEPGQRGLGASDAMAWSTVIGVVGDVRDQAMATAPGDILYAVVPNRAVEEWGLHPAAMAVVVRTERSPYSLASAVRAVVRRIDPDVPTSDLASMRELVAADTARTRFTMLLLALSALAALFLAAVGLYGLVSYGVSQRTHEIGVRMALGARAADVRRMVLSEGLGLTLLGVLVGLVAGLWATRLLAGLLYEISPHDPLTFAATALLLLGVATMASSAPAGRAARVDPVLALHRE